LVIILNFARSIELTTINLLLFFTCESLKTQTGYFLLPQLCEKHMTEFQQHKHRLADLKLEIDMIEYPEINTELSKYQYSVQNLV